MLKKIIVTLAFILIIGSIIEAKEGRIKGSYVNLRKEGRFNSPIIGKKMRGEVYKIIFEDRKWIKVSFSDGTIGWLYKTLTESEIYDKVEPKKIVTSTKIITEKKTDKSKKADSKKVTPKKIAKKIKKSKPVEKPAKKITKSVKIKDTEIIGTAEELYNEGISLYEQKRYAQALDKNRQALKKASNNAEIMNNIANCQFKLGRIEEALESWKEALKISPKSGKICNNLGIAYYQINRSKEAIEYYKKAILFEPEFSDPYYNLGSVYGFSGDFEDAITNYRKFLEISPDSIMKKLADERISYCERQLKKKKTKDDKKSEDKTEKTSAAKK